MSQPNETKRVTTASEGKCTAKKPYHKPEVRFERVFETMALACGKVQTTQSACHAARKAS
jgi:hypothetical protein